MSLDNLLSINFLSVDACNVVMLFWGSKWKTRVSEAGASFLFLPSRVLTISPLPKNTGKFSAGYNKQHKLHKGLTQFM